MPIRGTGKKNRWNLRCSASVQERIGNLVPRRLGRVLINAQMSGYGDEAKSLCSTRALPVSTPKRAFNGIPATQRIVVSDGHREGRPLSDDT